MRGIELVVEFTLRMKRSEVQAGTQAREEVLKGIRLRTLSWEEQESDWEFTEKVKLNRRRRMMGEKEESSISFPNYSNA